MRYEGMDLQGSPALWQVMNGSFECKRLPVMLAFWGGGQLDVPVSCRVVMITVYTVHKYNLTAPLQ
jgi:hypothetical protein